MASVPTDFSVQSADGRSALACYSRPCENPPAAVVQISHGMREHFGRYLDFARFLNENSIAVVGHDHIGHGHTAKEDSQLGYFAESGGWGCLVEDLRSVTLRAAALYPGVPVILLGHSMGSFVARLYLSEYSGLLGGVILSGTSGPLAAAAGGAALAGAVSKLRGGHYRSRFINNLAFGKYNGRIAGAQTPYDWLTRDRQVVGLYSADRLCDYIFTASAFKDLFTMVRLISKKSWAGTLAQNLPVLLLSGDMDPVGGYGRGVREVERRIRAAGVSDLAVKLYPGARHEVLNETNRGEVYGDILAWIKNHIR